MKALLINGSPHAKGCTYIALSELAKTLEAEGIEAEILHVGHQDIRGCIACGKCTELMRAGSKAGCVVRDGAVYMDLYKNADTALYETKQNGKDGYHVYMRT